MVEDKLTCTILFFATAAEAVGCDNQELTLKSGSTVKDVFDAIVQDHEQFASLKNNCAVAIDTALCSSSTLLHDGCTVAFLPPVSGG